MGFCAGSLERGGAVSAKMGLKLPRDRLARLQALLEALLDGLEAPALWARSPSSRWFSARFQRRWARRAARCGGSRAAANLRGGGFGDVGRAFGADSLGAASTGGGGDRPPLAESGGRVEGAGGALRGALQIGEPPYPRCAAGAGPQASARSGRANPHRVRRRLRARLLAGRGWAVGGGGAARVGGKWGRPPVLEVKRL